MALLEDIIKALERIPAWKRVSALPSEIDALNKRVSALEAKLAPATGTKCPSCGALTFRLITSKPSPPPWGDMGAMQDHYGCSSCPYTDVRERS